MIPFRAATPRVFVEFEVDHRQRLGIAIHMDGNGAVLRLTPDEAADWLQRNGYAYVVGTNGVWRKPSRLRQIMMRPAADAKAPRVLASQGRKASGAEQRAG